jgi:alpha-D-ribose 1-methylphosphonate 5-triphosphate diphosphatase PhnM
MYRAIPQANVLCSMAARARSYRLHREALAKIAARPQGVLIHQPLQPEQFRVFLREKAHREKQQQIDHENEKMRDALANCRPTLSRSEFAQHSADHEDQVRRKRGRTREIYGFPTEEESAEQFKKLGA